MKNSDTGSQELEMMQRLGIESWRNLSRDKFMTFVSELPNLDKEVAMKVVAQFPNFKELTADALSNAKEDASESRLYNWKSQKKVHEAYADYRATLEKELERDNLTSEDRFRILGLLREAINLESAKDSENKKFLFSKFVTVAGATVVALGVAVAAIGGKAQLGQKDDRPN